MDHNNESKILEQFAKALNVDINNIEFKEPTVSQSVLKKSFKDIMKEQKDREKKKIAVTQQQQESVTLFQLIKEEMSRSSS